MLAMLLLAGTACSGGHPATTPTTTADDASLSGFQVRTVLASSTGADGSLAGVPFTTGVLAPEDPYRNDPQFAEQTPDAKGDIVTFGDTNGDGYYSPASDTKYRLGPAVVTDTDVRSATASPAGSSGWAVNIALDERGTNALASVTHGLFGEQLAMLVDGLVIDVPFVQAPITTGHLQLTGGFTEAIATSLASQLRPAP
jgi:hypothetical protein